MLPDTDTLEILPGQLSELRDSGDAPDFRLVDCREEDEFAFCRIDGAELVPLSRFGEDAIPKLIENNDKPVVVYCHHGMRSLQATQFLRARGLEQVWSLAGGIDLWSQEIDSSVPRY